MSTQALPKISVCIANYNGEHLLHDCIDSVLSQTGAFEVEILVHDDASDDASLDLLRSHYPEVLILASTKNVGFCISNNRMGEAASGDYLLLLNNDAALAPGALSTLLAAEETAQPCILTLPQRDWDTGALVDRGCLLDPFYNPVPNLDAGRDDVAYVMGACLWIARDVWRELGGFPEWMGSIAEDTYLCSIARLKGMRVRALNASGFRHRIGASFGGAKVENNRLKTTFGRRHLSERNKTYVMFVCTPTPAAWLLTFVHICLLQVEGVVLSAIRGDFDIMRDIYANVPIALFRQRRQLIRLRQTVQAQRTVRARDFLSTFSWMPRKLSLLARHGLPVINRR